MEIQELVLKNLALPVADTDIEKAKSAVDQSEQGVKRCYIKFKADEVNYEQNKGHWKKPKSNIRVTRIYLNKSSFKAELDRSYEQVQIAEDKLRSFIHADQSAKSY